MPMAASPKSVENIFPIICTIVLWAIFLVVLIWLFCHPERSQSGAEGSVTVQNIGLTTCYLVIEGSSQ